MTPNDFCYWLQGFMEISGTKAIDKAQVAVIRKHLELVFANVTKGKVDMAKTLAGLGHHRVDAKFC